MDSRAQLVQYYRWLRQYGLNDAHSGNVSLRKQDKVWITPTGACADTLKITDLITCKIGQNPTKGASLDAALHLAVYAHNPQTRAVIHSHGAYSVAVTLNGQPFTPVDFEGQLYFPKIPVISIDYDRYVQTAPALVAEKLTQYPIAVVRGHGVYAHAKSLNLAYKWICSLELSAKTYFIAQQLRTIP
ncbi:MAG: class II aldolase [Beggiatoa sp. IS2]|nr:MAG: class II aldolase [Beggiatoa sp. IS2]